MDRNKRKVRLTSCSSYENKKPLFHTFCHKKSHEVRRCEIEACIVSCIFMYRISANSFRGNYSFLNLALFTVTFDLYFINLNSCRGNYSKEETIQGRKLFAEIRYLKSLFLLSFFAKILLRSLRKKMEKYQKGYIRDRTRDLECCLRSLDHLG